jgi:tetratricopeptide (TPR) repeat protein
MCSKCNQYLEISPEQFDDLVVTLKARCAEAIVALTEGETTLTFEAGNSESEPIGCVEYLVDAVDWLYDADEQAFVDGVVEKLRLTNQVFAQESIQAELLRIQGRRREAIDRMHAIISDHGVQSITAKRVATLLTVEKRHLESAEAWRKALSVETDDRHKVRLLAARVDALMSAKQWAEAVKVYDELFSVAPTIANDRAIQKLYAKARNKAGIA